MTDSGRRSDEAARPDEPAEHTVLPSVDHEPLHPDRVAQLAYRRYESRGYGHGRDVDDWLEAERELRESPPRSQD